MNPRDGRSPECGIAEREYDDEPRSDFGISRRLITNGQGVICVQGSSKAPLPLSVKAYLVESLKGQASAKDRWFAIPFVKGKGPERGKSLESPKYHAKVKGLIRFAFPQVSTMQ